MGSFHQGGTFEPYNSVSKKTLKVKKNVDMEKAVKFR
jgi:hypothetical protein